MMRDEVVRRRNWLTDDDFLDMVGATNIIPGPNSTELAIHLGHRRGGWAGLITAGVFFIVPAMLIVLGLAVIYVRYGTTAEATWLLYGVKPVIIAIILQALWVLGRRALKNTTLTLVGIATLILYFVGVNEVFLVFAGGLALFLIHRGKILFNSGLMPLFVPLGSISFSTVPAGAAP